MALAGLLLCAACAATPEEVKPERISPLDYRESTCQELQSHIAANRVEEAELVQLMNAWPREGGGNVVRRIDIGRKLANVRGKIEAASDVYTRWNCAERLKYIG
ncbi:hypothetical protein GCM10007276_09330 [Agaricicola taiwanensis]|uniref:Uncharacterized protein n=1 Tax=Agaricicola taiwanensis TaxID=591372 RepID=A0A8J2VK92_9RHOB|nr:hypothetical protein GCM10007276_09330 [Agaricicola taiwanensis]